MLASGGKVIEAGPNSQTEATATIDVPADGRYLVAVRVGGPTKTGAGAVKAMSDAVHSLDVILRHEDTTELEWPVQRSAPTDIEFHWSVFQWVRQVVELKAGSTVIALRPVPGATPDGSQRRVDCVVVTADTSYDPDYRDFVPQLYARITLRDAPRPVALAHPMTTGRVQRGPFTRPLAPGESTGWMNVTRFFTGGPNDSFAIAAAEKVDHATYTVDFAAGPSDDRVFKTVERHGNGSDVRIAIAGDVSASAPPVADFEYAKQRADLVAQLPRVSFGRRPTRFPILAEYDTANGVREQEMKVMAYVGVNGRPGLLDDVDLRNGIVTSRLYNVVYYVGEHGQLSPDLEASRKDLAVDARTVAASPYKDRVQHLKLMDEAHPWTLEQLAADPLAQDKFRAWMTKNGFDPFSPEERRRLSRAGADEAMHPVADRAAEFPGLYYYSQRFRSSTIVDFYAELTKLAHETYPPGIRTTQDFSDGAVGAGNLYFNGNDYFDYFRNDALDVALTEDWTDAGATRELAAWNVALLRAATREKGQPIHMYVVAYSNRRPVEVKIKAMEELSEGVKLLYFYDYLPRYHGGNMIGWAEDPLMFPALSELTHEVGAAEDALSNAMPRPAETAVYYSIPGDIWMVGLDSAPGLERMYTYLALRHAQIPVDVIGDDQARRGGLSQYKVVYLPSEQVDRRDVPVLARWVQAGGTLVLGPGAASRDEWNRPNRKLDEALRLPRREVEEPGPKERSNASSASYCTAVKPRGTVSLMAGVAPGTESQGAEAQIMGARQSFSEGPDVTVLARFQPTNDAAAVSIQRGRGRVILVGFFPAIDYGCEAYRTFKSTESKELVHPISILAAAKSVLDPTHPKPEAVQMTRLDESGMLPFRYAPSLRAFITAPASAARVSRPVAVSVPQVVTSFLEGKEGWTVPLANVTGAPLAKIEVTLSPGRPVSEVFSSRLGKLPVEQRGAGLHVALPLESTDILYGVWR
jgi:hypothetical protein